MVAARQDRRDTRAYRSFADTQRALAVDQCRVADPYPDNIGNGVQRTGHAVEGPRSLARAFCCASTVAGRLDTMRRGKTARPTGRENKRFMTFLLDWPEDGGGGSDRLLKKCCALSCMIWRDESRTSVVRITFTWDRTLPKCFGPRQERKEKPNKSLPQPAHVEAASGLTSSAAWPLDPGAERPWTYRWRFEGDELVLSWRRCPDLPRSGPRTPGQKAVKPSQTPQATSTKPVTLPAATPASITFSMRTNKARPTIQIRFITPP